MTRIRLYQSIVLLILADLCLSNELSRCCGGGSRHFKKTSTCSNIKSEGSSATCVRAASICCLRTLLDESCDDGAQAAQVDETCPISINVLGGGLKKECCECCLLAKDILKRNEACIAPTGFSAACLRSFNKCCSSSGSFDLTHSNGGGSIITGRPYENTQMHLGDRCENAQCEHLCHDRGGDTVECSCRVGYDLAPDGYSCVVHVHRYRPASSFGMGSEKCINERGEYYDCSMAGLRNKAGIGEMAVREGEVPKRDSKIANNPWKMSTGAGEQKRGGAGSIPIRQNGKPTAIGCAKGWNYENGRCVDIDECQLLQDDCLESQRCFNLPGSFKCIRTLSCGTGYTMDSKTEQCTVHNLSCDPKKCGEGELQNPITGECISVQCPLGYYPKNGMCNDVDECAQQDRCSPSEECVNTPGSYRCQQKGNLCGNGYEVNKDSGFCEDIDECKTGMPCGNNMCINVLGSFKCRCNAGYEFNDITKRCEDIDECKKFADVDECSIGLAKCEQRCINTPGSYQCICDRGFALGVDGLTCEDIDECSVWAGSGNELCMGGCINTKGSYLCQCPPGYKIQPDGRTCIDIDECSASGECQGSERVCVNTLGSFKCHQIECPENYIHDYNNKNSVEDGYSCLKNCKEEDNVCIANITREILYQFRAIPSFKFIKFPIEVSFAI
ncbi:hypothetical protein WR25_12503 [Diploscapter pachys]|uniref:EGF-like domain-containing protein n=1 Tax=Diploscapter pachys TaxID=2018661 RepID=A0A2A2JDX0_9BILA|nr:hypothetical protein WR25_12503 [Diploscapter pachys]